MYLSRRKEKRVYFSLQSCNVDRSILPSDAYFKGYRDVIIQDVSIKPVNTNYRIEIFYSPSEHKTYSGKLPDCIKGEFGPGIKSLIITLNHGKGGYDFPDHIPEETISNNINFYKFSIYAGIDPFYGSNRTFFSIGSRKVFKIVRSEQKF